MSIKFVLLEWLCIVAQLQAVHSQLVIRSCWQDIWPLTLNPRLLYITFTSSYVSWLMHYEVFYLRINYDGLISIHHNVFHNFLSLYEAKTLLGLILLFGILKVPFSRKKISLWTLSAMDAIHLKHSPTLVLWSDTNVDFHIRW